MKVRLGNIDVQTDKKIEGEFERNGAEFESIPLQLLDGRVIEVFANGYIQIWSPAVMLMETTVDDIVQSRITVI